MKSQLLLICLILLFKTNILFGACPPPILINASSDCAKDVRVVGNGASASAIITVFANSINIGSGTADISGDFNFSIPTFLNDGNYLITVTQTNISCTSTTSNGMIITINAAQTPNLLKASADCLGNINVVGNGADAGAVISVFANSMNIGSGTANDTGSFEFTLGSNLSNGNYLISVTQTNSGACESDQSNIINVIVNQACQPNVQQFLLSQFTQAVISKYC